MNAIILGGTKGMGRALARAMAARGDRLFLLGRHPEELNKCAKDLQIRSPQSKVGTGPCDLEQSSTFAPALVAAKTFFASKIDAVVITAGLFATQDVLEKDADFTRRMLHVNFTATIDFCEQIRQLLLTQGGGTLCVFSSVAGDRGRKPVILYGASKAGLTAYLEGLDHKFRAQGLRTICVKPGFVKTSMTDGLNPPPFAGTPEQVAKHVLHAIDRGCPVIYTPCIWRWILFVIRRLPRFIMRRISF